MYRWLHLFVVLQITLLSGCYTSQIAYSIDAHTIASSQFSESLNEGQFVRVFTYPSLRNSLETREGRIIRIRRDALLIHQAERPFSISFDKIHKIEMLEQRLDKKRTALAVIVTGTAIYIAHHYRDRLISLLPQRQNGFSF
jgi:hypothetical protein